MFGLPSIIAVIMNYVRASEARGTYLESHFSWQLRTFWFAALWVVLFLLSLPLFLVLVGFVMLIGRHHRRGLWVVYRVARGWLKLKDAQPVRIRLKRGNFNDAMVVAQDKVVLIHYTLTNDAGKVLDSSSGGEPLAYIHGQGNLISGLEKALEGKQAGDKLERATSRRPTATACATRRWCSACRCARSAMPRTSKPGMQFQAQIRRARQQVVTVTGVIQGDMVTVDANHPLAGENLHFDVEITDIREARRRNSSTATCTARVVTPPRLSVRWPRGAVRPSACAASAALAGHGGPARENRCSAPQRRRVAPIDVVPEHDLPVGRRLRRPVEDQHGHRLFQVHRLASASTATTSAIDCWFHRCGSFSTSSASSNGFCTRMQPELNARSSSVVQRLRRRVVQVHEVRIREHDLHESRAHCSGPGSCRN